MKLDTYLPMIEQKLEELLPKEHCRYERLIEAMRYSLLAVSYTHLDVYKRQEPGRVAEVYKAGELLAQGSGNSVADRGRDHSGICTVA